MAGIVNRMVRAAKLDKNLYEEVEADKSAMGQAITTVILSGLAAGIGSYSAGGISGLVAVTIGGIAGWFVWAYITYFIGTKLLSEAQTQATHGQLLRTIGFSSSPGILRALGIIPGLYQASLAIASIWMLITMVIAVRQALDFRSTFRAVGVVLIGWLIYIIIFTVIGFLFFNAAPGQAGYNI
ncbi:MAG: YIP1 family protein [Candidatus Latescibacterota bacterium]